MAEKTIEWQNGGGISLAAPDFKGEQILTIASTANNGAARSQDIVLRAEQDPTKAITIHVDQAEAARQTVVVQDWTNTGQLCNSAGTVGAYDCDGTYSVQYYQQSRILEDRYPDGTGAINRRTEYRVGAQASRRQVNGQCGYSPSIPVQIYVGNPQDAGFAPYGWGSLESSASYMLDLPDDQYEEVLSAGVNVIELNADERILEVYASPYNPTDEGIFYTARLYHGSDPNTTYGEPIAEESAMIDAHGYGNEVLYLNHNYTDGMAEYVLVFILN